MAITEHASRRNTAVAGTSGWWQYFADVVGWVAALAVGIVIALHRLPDRSNLWHVLILAGTVAALQFVIGLVSKLYRRRYWAGSLEEANTFTVVTTVNAFLAAVVALIARLPILPVIIAWPMAMCFGFFVRYLHRQMVARNQTPMSGNTKRTLIYGAGNLGTMTVRRMLEDPLSPYYPIGFIDDDPAKRNLVVRTVPVLGDFDSVAAKKAGNPGFDVILVAIDTPAPELLSRVVELSPTLGVEVKVVPTREAAFGRNRSVGSIRSIRIDDLMEHHKSSLDIDSMCGYLCGKRVLVTGAGGSIGQELCIQVNKLAPSALILLDHDETHLQDTEFALYGTGLLVRDDIVLADIRDKAALREVFEQWHPDVVFHAAALKHVPMLERFPHEAWDTNVMGTLNVLECAREVGVETFINVSTDKAAAPTTILGFSKRMAEHLTSWTGQHATGHYLSVRFGNVFGSRGSMVPLFQKAIERDIPLRVTSKEATRFFMTIPEACQLVIAAGADSHSGDVMILDMGQPMNIYDIAKRLIEMSGKDVPIEIVGMRPAEKTNEVLTSREDGVGNTPPESGIMRVHATPVDPAELDFGIWLATVRPESNRSGITAPDFGDLPSLALVSATSAERNLRGV